MHFDSLHNSYFFGSAILRMTDSIDERRRHTISVLDVINIADKAWKLATETIIQNCFKACDFQKEGLEPQFELLDELLYNIRWNYQFQSPDGTFWCHKMNEILLGSWTLSR